MIIIINFENNLYEIRIKKIERFKYQDWYWLNYIKIIL